MMEVRPLSLYKLGYMATGVNVHKPDNPRVPGGREG
jgi:hypothetical protein